MAWWNARPLATLSASIALALSAVAADSERSRDLKILYAGHSGTEREKDFVAFLSKHFASVEAAEVEGLSESRARRFDVTILDYDGRGFNSPQPAISRGYTRPIVTIGVYGALLCGRWGLKTDYL